MGREIRTVVASGVGGAVGRWDRLGRGKKELQAEGTFYKFSYLVEYDC